MFEIECWYMEPMIYTKFQHVLQKKLLIIYDNLIYAEILIRLKQFDYNCRKSYLHLYWICKLPSLKPNNFAPENRPFAQKKKASSSQPSIFQVRNVSFRVSGRVTNWIGHLVTLFSKASNGIHFEPKIQVSSSDAANLQISESLAEVIEESGGKTTRFFGWVFVEGKMWRVETLGKSLKALKMCDVSCGFLKLEWGKVLFALWNPCPKVWDVWTGVWSTPPKLTWFTVLQTRHVWWSSFWLWR